MILYKLHLLNNPLGLVVLLGELLVSQELGVHSSGGNVLGTLLLLDAVGVSLVRVVVRTGVLLLLGSKEKSRGGNKEGEMIYSYTINMLSSRCFAVGKNAFAKEPFRHCTQPQTTAFIPILPAAGVRRTEGRGGISPHVTKPRLMETARSPTPQPQPPELLSKLNTPHKHGFVGLDTPHGRTTSRWATFRQRTHNPMAARGQWRDLDVAHGDGHPICSRGATPVVALSTAFATLSNTTLQAIVAALGRTLTILTGCFPKRSELRIGG